MIEIRLPKPGPEIENATITKWESKEGDNIQIGDILAIIKTPIGSFKVAAEEQGILESILQSEGNAIDFDEPIAIMHPDLRISDFPELQDENDDTLPLPIENPILEETDDTPEQESEEPPPEEEANTEDLTDTIKLEEDDSSEAKTEASINPDSDEDAWNDEEEEEPPVSLKLNPNDSGDSTETEEPGPEFEVETETVSELEANILEETDIKIASPEVEISPAAKKMAERMAIDLATVAGTGDEGKILYIDVENAIHEREEAAEERVKEVLSEPIESGVSEGETVTEDEETPDEPSDNAQEDSVIETFEPEDDTIGEDSSNEEEESEDWELEEPLSGEEIAFDSDEVHVDEMENFAAVVEPDEDEIDQEEASVPPPESPIETDPPVMIPQLDKEISNEDLSDLTGDDSQPEPSVAVQDNPFPDYEEISAQFHLSKKDDLIIPFNSNKKSYAASQLESNRSIPHFYLISDIDFTEGQKWMADHNQRNASKITLTDLIVKATGQALAMMPEMNAFVRNDRVILKRSINIGLTMSVDEGVVTPVIPDVYHKSLHKISEAVKKNVDLATKTKVILDYDTTFTVNLLQDSGVKRFIPLISPPQTGCLAIGEVQKKVIPLDNFIAIRDIMEFTLACDSRAVDASNAAKFLQSIREYIESLTVGEEDPDWVEGNEQLRLI